MGRSPYYVSPATRMRNLRRAVGYFKSKSIANLRKLPDLVIETCAMIDIQPAQPQTLKLTPSPNKFIHVQPYIPPKPPPRQISKPLHSSQFPPDPQPRKTAKARRVLPPPRPNPFDCFN